MAFFQETVRSLRLYLIFVGIISTLVNLAAVVASGTTIVVRLLLLPALALSIVFLYLGFTLAAKLQTSLPFVLNVFRAVIVLNVLYLGLGVAGALMGLGGFSLFPVVAIVVGWYLLRSARRLGTGLRAGGA